MRDLERRWGNAIHKRKKVADSLFGIERKRTKDYLERKIREAEEEATSMVHPAMVGITELMTDDNFLVWMENQEEDLLERLSTYEVYTRFQSEMASVTTH